MKALKTGCRSTRGLVVALVGAVSLLPLTGCLSVRTRTVNKTVVASNVQEATLDELLKQMANRYAAVNTLNLSVNITATTGGAHQGEVKEYPSFAGYIFLRKPADLRVLMLVPFVRSRALDMVSDGKNFKLLISAPKAKAILGPEVMTTPSKNGLENLRPNIIRDALQVPPVEPDDFVALTTGFRTLAPAHGKKEAIEEPDYDLTILRRKAGETNERVLERVRVIHISRVTLLPYEQDLYDDAGRLVTTINYDKFQKFGDLMYPTSIFLKRPIDEYTLQIDVTKLVLNQPLDDEAFKLVIPEGVPVQKM
jgi:outer membrane lipoprotein-sorting protein